MEETARQTLSALCAAPGINGTLNSAQLDEIMECTGGTIMVCGYLRNIEVKQLSANVFKVTSGGLVNPEPPAPESTPPDTTEIDIVFDGSPPASASEFVEVERTSDRRGMNVGEWVERDDGYWALRMRISTKSINGVYEPQPNPNIVPTDAKPDASDALSEAAREGL